MATAEIALTGGANWVKVVDFNESFLLENGSSYDVYVTFQDIAPDLSLTAYHVLVDGEAMVRMGLSGDVYVRSPNTTTIDVSRS